MWLDEANTVVLHVHIHVHEAGNRIAVFVQAQSVDKIRRLKPSEVLGKTRLVSTY